MRTSEYVNLALKCDIFQLPPRGEDDNQMGNGVGATEDCLHFKAATSDGPEAEPKLNTHRMA